MTNVISMSRIELIVDPQWGDLYTGPAPIVRGTRFSPLQEIRVEVSCTDGFGRLWKSSNNYLVSAEGIFDTSLTAAVGDGYYGVAPEGPFTSMTCQEPGDNDAGTASGSASRPGDNHRPDAGTASGYDFGVKNLHRLEYKVACFDGSTEIWSREVARYLGREHVPDPSVKVLLFDDEVTSDEMDAMFALAPYGVAVVGDATQGAVANYHDLGVPAAELSLPTFIVGSGRASARALEAAMALRDIQGVILFSGGGLRFDPIFGGHYDQGGHWIKQDLPYIKLDHSSLQPRAEGLLTTRKLYAEAVADKANRERGRIAVEKIRSPLYMFSGLDDQIWPSSAFSELVAQRRKMKSCSFPTYHRTFEGVGHDIGPSLGLPTLPTTERTISHPDTGFRLLLGGKMGRQARARRECWDTLLKILAGDPPTA